MLENYHTVTTDKKSDNDLEDGEIREELEDISDCSLSETLSIQEDLNDCDTELLREEAMKSLHQEKDEVTEEELYRLEALKSLLVNLESTDKFEEKSISKLREKKRRKRKKKTKKKPDNKRRKVLMMKAKKAKNYSIPVIEIELTGKNDLNSKDHQSRPWYPRNEFVLLSTFLIDDMKQVKVKCKPEIDLKPEAKYKSTSEKLFPVPRVHPIKSVEINQTHRPEPLKAPGSQFKSQFKKVTKHSIRKIDLTLPVSNKFALNKTGKYKAVNVSKYALKETNPKNDTLSTKSAAFHSKYSINRKRTQLPRINPKDFVIKLNNDDDSGNENESNFSTSSGVTTEGNESTNCQCCEEKASKFSDNTESSPPFVIDTNPDPLGFSGQKNILFGYESDYNKTFKGSTQPNICGASLETKKLSTLAQKKLPNDFPTDSTPDHRPLTVNETDNGKIDKSKSNLLKDAEMNLIKIRTRLLSDIVELEDAIKRNTVEETKLNNMMKKFIALQSMVLKFEKRIDLQKSKLALSSKSMYLLFKSVELRSGTCSQMKKICIRAGKGVVGSDYRPPEEYENVITTKRNAIDFSRYASLNVNT